MNNTNTISTVKTPVLNHDRNTVWSVVNSIQFLVGYLHIRLECDWMEAAAAWMLCPLAVVLEKEREIFCISLSFEMLNRKRIPRLENQRKSRRTSCWWIMMPSRTCSLGNQSTLSWLLLQLQLDKEKRDWPKKHLIEWRTGQVRD